MKLPGARLRAAFFCAYAVPLFMATHWPALTVPMQGRWDLPIHAAVFAVWYILLAAVGLFGPVLAARNILMSALAASVYAAVDEGLQAVPVLRRTAALDDFAANLLGVWLAALLAYVCGVYSVRGKKA